MQGITEFLPVSSDGHLVLVAPLLFGGSGDAPEMLDLTIALHMGTLGSILLFLPAAALPGCFSKTGGGAD